MRAASRLVLLSSLATAAASGLDQPPAHVAAAARDTHPVIEMIEPSRWRRLAPPGERSDPIAPLGATDAVAFAATKPAPAAITAFLAGYVDRIEELYRPLAAPGLLAWLATRPKIRRDLWLAIDPVFDQAGPALAVFEGLRLHDAKRLESFHHLAIALAVVHDSPEAVTSSTYTAIWGVEPGQFCAPQSAVGLFDYFTDARHLALFPIKPNQMCWSMLVHVADLDLDAGQCAWALANEAKRRTDVAALYPAVPYDNAKLAAKQGRLGASPYTLANLLESGGVCGDQAHYASRVAKAFCLPAMKVTGESRYGGMGHAWCGFLAAKAGRPVLEFTGRYNFDFYYTGEVFDPQTRTRTLDRYVALAYDGASQSFERMQAADALARAGLACRADQPATSLALARAAIEQNRYCAAGWRLLMGHIASGTLPRKEAPPWGQRMLTELAAHPDLTLECLDLYLRSIPVAEIDERQRLWSAAHPLYAQRPDLQIALRLRQCGELVAAGRGQVALGKVLETVVANAKEGTLVLPLVGLAVDLSRSLAGTPAFRLAAVKAALAAADADFPKQRGNEPSQAYAEFRKLVGAL